MSCIDLNHISPADLQQQLAAHSTVVACLCAAWCDVCKSYRSRFEALAAEHADLLFIWIDIEDQAGLVDHLEVDNFPTLLLQRDDIVAFYGTMLPDTSHLKRQIANLSDKSLSQLQQLADSGETQRIWQRDANIRRRLAEHV